MINKKNFMVALMSLFESKLKTYTEKTIDVWYNELKDYPEEDVLRGIKKLIQSKEGFISVGKVVEQFSKKAIDTSTIWGNIVRVAEDGGRSWDSLTSVEVKVVMTMGGLGRFQNASGDNLHFMQNQYLKIVEDLSLADVPEYFGEEKLRRLNVDNSSLKFLLKETNQKVLPEKKEDQKRLEGMSGKIGKKI